VPKDLKLNAHEEIFNVRVLYDTLELYGKVTATQKVVIYRD
jgi:hypothetical protein